MIDIAKIAKLSPEEYENYEVSRLQYLEIKGVADTAYMEGEQAAQEKFAALLQQAEAKAEEAEARIEAERQQKEALAALFIKTLYETGKAFEEIAMLTNLPLSEVQRFLKK